ncbi:LysE/ArgO family amino acid transporter [Paracoccus marinaquae]|uniref:LysE/ArgO family amino acid transporter n=1 Tax=Paracoccus marinaquae TaxID=2841926 RepID=A0ABS6AJM6_9RHOB|nr:LysE/ArgO family amino acid transporter [Paracoccus marinaquae]MBU3029860.1 LysE/ArgO family amino acid transporter [Paracoccus marinaquae]
MTSFLAGLGTSLSLIAAIGAQNAFVLKQGLLRRHVLACCLFCATSDMVLITAGVFGMSAAGVHLPWLAGAMRWGGVVFLLFYGARSFRAALRGGEALRPEGQGAGLAATLTTLAALTWLNPHVYLDTVVLLGAISAQWPDRVAFAIGASAASFLFFLSLGFGARFLAPYFARPRAWQWLEAGVGCVMWGIALRLIAG